MTQDWPLALLVVLLGPVIGSGLGAFIDRWAAGRSLWSRSACDACGTALRPRDLVPLLSGLGGRCRHCGAVIPGHLMRLEVACLGLSVLAVALARDPGHMLLLASYFWTLAGLFYADLLHLRLPNALNGLLLAAGLGLAWLDPARGLAEGALAAALGAGAFWTLRWVYQAVRGREGLGLGDVKLMGGIGAGVGGLHLPATVLIAAVMGLVMALWEARGGRLAGTARIPFGACLAGAAVIVLCL